VLAVGGALAITGALASAGWLSPGGSEASTAGAGSGASTVAAAHAGDCPRVAHVVTATSFAPVLTSLSKQLAQGDQCVRLEVVRADGRGAAAEVAKDGADVWIPDDTSWQHMAPPGLLAPDQAHGAGTVLATSPIFMVTDGGTAQRLERAGGSWLGLADMLQNGSGVRLLVRDPAGSGDGMVGAGSVAEAVWIRSGMDASALALEKIVPKARTARGAVAMPTAPGEVGIVPEYALLPALARYGQPKPAVLPGTDRTAQLRFTWFPTAKALADPARADMLDRLHAALTGAQAAPALDAAGLRPPRSSTPPTQGRQRVPDSTAAPLPVLAAHHVDHVFASWFRDDRRVNATMVVDVSWSMSSLAPGSRSPLIDLVRDGVQEVGGMLPDKSQLGLWAFGSRLDGPRDYLKVLPIGPLTRAHRQALASAVQRLQAEHTGTGLYDTTLAAYTAARDAYTPGASNQVMVFTDGINDDDPGSISLADLSRELKKAQDPHRPVQLSVVLFGEQRQADELSKALEPVQAYVESLTTANQVEAMFIHLATGGLHSEYTS
jgi:von Willebrand factor type A domain